jgi:glutamate dehydrogenase/leucine dehydrogenase
MTECLNILVLHWRSCRRYGVGGREVGYMFGQYKRLRNEFTGVLEGISFGGH